MDWIYIYICEFYFNLNKSNYYIVADYDDCNDISIYTHADSSHNDDSGKVTPGKAPNTTYGGYNQGAIATYDYLTDCIIGKDETISKINCSVKDQNLIQNILIPI